jgi:hypothetical protein
MKIAWKMMKIVKISILNEIKNQDRLGSKFELWFKIVGEKKN